MNLWVAQDVIEKCGFEISEGRGFLPAEDPLLSLHACPRWEAAAEQVCGLVNASRVREVVARLPPLEVAKLRTRAELERAMLLLSVFGHAYLRDRPGPQPELPPQLAVPWSEVAARLGRPPVLAHASIVLQNWRRIDPQGPIALGNLATLMQFHGGLDEAWFYLVTVEIEAVGARGVFHLIEAVCEAGRGEEGAVCRHLAVATEVLAQMSASLLKVRERCDPYIFYHRVRPFLSSLEDVVYDGVDPRLQSHHGGSAAQSSLLQTYDRALGLDHPDDPARSYMVQMLNYMPPRHRAFVDFIGAEPLATFCRGSAALEEAFGACVEALRAFRQHHLEIVAHYIVAQARDEEQERGTGGTSPMRFLKQMKRDTTPSPR